MGLLRRWLGLVPTSVVIEAAFRNPVELSLDGSGGLLIIDHDACAVRYLDRAVPPMVHRYHRDRHCETARELLPLLRALIVIWAGRSDRLSGRGPHRRVMPVCMERLFGWIRDAHWPGIATRRIMAQTIAFEV